MMIPTLRFIRHLAVFAVAFVSGACWAADAVVVSNQSDVRWAPCGKDAPWNKCERFVVRGDPAKEASESMLRFAKGFAFPKHWHDNAEQVVILSGVMIIAFDGGREETVRAGGYLYIPAKAAHWGTCPDGCTFYLGIVGPDSYYE